MITEVAVQLKKARIKSGFSQNEIATILHVTRQSISKWENGRGYPDLDNLIQLSEVYKISIDNLLKENDELKAKIDANEEKIAQKKQALKTVNTDLYQNIDEGVLLIILTLVSAILPPIGCILPLYVIWRNNKYNSLYKTIFVIALFVICVSLIGTYVIVSDNWLQPSNTEVYRIN
ncbi:MULTISPECIES: helix-turn-helix domain-containing protein [Lactobacillaceae]|uniref:helix-turn-helix domain-containing protein n=1 Tax=Lactobacillaceae TaxID=33958 RepID=UPI0014565667|nr:helix-turn-helix domain-containing protein [Lactobacillus sp. HBUAS51381]NLR10426.1 helix-turn-helix domain-containing protein [Lactobacillus sp. HBUAS51381]